MNELEGRGTTGGPGAAMTSSEWDRPSITDYYDARTDVVERCARRLEQLNGDAVDAALKAVVTGVYARADELCLDEVGIAGLAISAVDDLYKTTATATTWTRATDLYVMASFGAVFRVVAARGYQVRYVVSTTFPNLQLGLRGCWNSFEQAGLHFVSPQIFAYALAARRGAIAPDAPVALHDLEPDIEEGRLLAQEASRAAIAGRQHLVYFDVDPIAGYFDHVLTGEIPPGTIIIYRCEAPLPGSKVHVRVAPIIT